MALEGLLQRNLHHSFCDKWHLPECWFYKSENRCRFGESALVCTARLKNSQARSEKNGDTSAAVMLQKNEHQQRMGIIKNTTIGCVFQDMEPPKSSSILRKSSDTRKPIRCVKFTKTIVRHAKIRDKNPSFGMICPGELHHRNPNAPKFEDRF